jgi:hypothetical protein
MKFLLCRPDFFVPRQPESLFFVYRLSLVKLKLKKPGIFVSKLAENM